jgi:ABC-2 type transport system permease protein
VTRLAPAEAELRPVNQPSLFWRGTVSDLRDVWEHRELLRAFTGRELRARYKGTAFGWAWALVRPIVMLLIYGLAVGIFLGAGRTIPQFMVFIYCGLLAWTLFSTIVVNCINSVISNGGLLTRASFPRLLLPISAVLAGMVDFCLQSLVLGIGWAIFMDVPDAADLLYLPPALFVLVLFGSGVGMLLAAGNVYIRDISFLADVSLQVGFWLAPIIYSYGQVVRGAQEFGLAADLVTRVYMLNPMANVIIGFQRALWPAGTSEAAAEFAFPGALAERLGAFSVLSLLVAWFGMRVFVKLSGNFGQEL